MTTKFAAYDDQAIWGVGPTPEAALSDARVWLDNTRPREIDAAVAAMETRVMTPELAAQVDRGNPTSFGRLPDGRLGTDQQHYDAA